MRFFGFHTGKEKAKRLIRLREPDQFTLITGAEKESIDAELDEGNRVVRLIVKTRFGNLLRRKNNQLRG